MFRFAACLVSSFILLTTDSVHAQVHAVGASFPSKVYTRWAERFERESGIKVEYKPTGSGDGVKQITDRKVLFAGSDSPLPSAELNKRQLVQLPTVVGGIVPVVNLPGLGDAQVQLDGAALADIMRGTIDRWDHPRIAELNRGVRLPAMPIKRVVRAEKSGTTEGFTRYLSLVSPDFKKQVGVSQMPEWPAAVIKAEGNDGVSKAMKTQTGAIGYVSYDRVLSDSLASVRMRNAAGRFVKATEAAFRAAIVESDLSRRGEDSASLMDRPGAEAWPITMATFVLFDASPKAAADVGPALRFLYWCYQNGDSLTKGTGFAPLPTTVQGRLASRFAEVKSQDGKQIPYNGY